MDELDQLLIGQTLEGGWVVQEPRHVQRDAPSASRAYLASNPQGTNAFVKVLDPRADRTLKAGDSFFNALGAVHSLAAAPRVEVDHRQGQAVGDTGTLRLIMPVIPLHQVLAFRSCQ